MMSRRTLLAAGAAALGGAGARAAAGGKVKFGLDLFSLRSQGWTPGQYLDFCAKRGIRVVHFSEVRFLGGLEPENLKQVRAHAEELGIEVEIGMLSICPTSTLFDISQGDGGGTAHAHGWRRRARWGRRSCAACWEARPTAPAPIPHRGPHREHRAGCCATCARG